MILRPRQLRQGRRSRRSIGRSQTHSMKRRIDAADLQQRPMCQPDPNARSSLGGHQEIHLPGSEIRRRSSAVHPAPRRLLVPSRVHPRSHFEANACEANRAPYKCTKDAGQGGNPKCHEASKAPRGNSTLPSRWLDAGPGMANGFASRSIARAAAGPSSVRPVACRLLTSAWYRSRPSATGSARVLPPRVRADGDWIC